MRAYLDRDRRLAPTAKQLFIHRNTLQYRLKRYEELTGGDLERTAHFVEVWWALRYRETRHSPANEKVE